MYFTTTTELVQETEKIIQEVNRKFKHLTLEQFNWKPTPKKWSVGQCIDHLIISKKRYDTAYQTILEGKYKKSGWQQIGFLNRMWGKQLLKALDPRNRKPVKTFSVFEPAQSDVSLDKLAEFEKTYEEFMETLKAFEKIDLEKTILRSPITSMINYSLLDGLNIIVVHAHRHILQAEEIVELLK